MPHSSRPQRIRRYRAIPEQLSIALIIRTKDRPHLLTRCLQSVADQKRLPDEIIVVNDAGATVDDIVQRFDELNIQLLNLTENLGRAGAGNRGVEQASSQVIGFLDDDDCYYPDHLQRLEKAMLQFDAKVAYSGCRLLQRDLQGDDTLLQETPLGTYNEAFDAQRLRYENYIPLINLLIDRELWHSSGGFDTEFEVFEDWDMLLRLARQCRFYHLNRITADYVVWGGGQITRDTQREQWYRAYRQILQKHIAPLADAAQLDLLAEYWRVSQQRRGVMQDSQRELAKLQLELLASQQKLLEKQNQYDQQCQQYSQQLADKSQQVDQLQQYADQQQTRFQEQQTRFQEQVRQYERQIEQQYNSAKNHQQQFEKLQSIYEEHTKTAKQREAELQTAYQKLERAFSELQVLDQATQQHNQQLHAQLEELSRQHALGMSKLDLDKFIQTRVEAYSLGKDNDKVVADYQRLVEWIRLKAQQLGDLTHTTTAQLEPMQQQHAAVQQQVQQLIDLLNASRWPQVRRYVNAVRDIGDKAKHLFDAAQAPLHEVADWQQRLGLQAVQTRSTGNINWDVPPPRPLSTLYPVFAAIAGSNDKPLFMEAVPEQAADLTAVFLEPHVSLVFTTYCGIDDFYRLDVLFATCIRINPCRVRMLIRELHSSEVLRTVYLEGMELFDNYYASFEFSPIQNSAGKTYQIEFDSLDSTPDTAVAVWCQAKPPCRAAQQQIPTQQLLHSPDDLPQAVQQSLLSLPAHEQLAASAPHLFLVNGLSATTSVLQLHVFLMQLNQALAQVDKQGQVVLLGIANPSVITYCEQHNLTRLEAMNFTESLNWLKNQIQTEYAWQCAIHALPNSGTLQQALRIFADYPNTALLTPLEHNSAQDIRAGYAHVLRDGSIQATPPIGQSADYPQHRFGRQIFAASSQLLALKTTCLDHLDINAVAAYQTPLYQVTDCIWQLLEQQQHSRYEASWHYVTEQPAEVLDAEACKQDLALFSKRWAAQLPTHTPPFVLELDTLLNPQQQPSVLIIDATLPTYDEDSGSLRLYTLLKIWAALGYRISFFPDNLDGNLKYREALEHLGIEVFHGVHGIGEVLATRHYDFAFICRVDVAHRHMPFVHLMSPDTIIFYDTVDIHYVREERQAEIENNPKLLRQAQATKRRELYNCKMADKVITVTDDDGVHLQKELPFLQYAVLPNIHTQVSAPTTDFAEREGLVFIGNYNHTPNEDAVYFFVETVLPKIATRLPQVKFYVVGSNMRHEMTQLASDNVEIVGWVDEVPPEFAKRRVFVSYLRYGAGMKGKLGQALSLGLPIVTTTIGAEGMGLIEGETALIADDPDSFAEAVCRLYSQQALWEKLSRQGCEYIESEYGETAFKGKLQNLLTEYAK